MLTQRRTFFSLALALLLLAMLSLGVAAGPTKEAKADSTYLYTYTSVENTDYRPGEVCIDHQKYVQGFILWTTYRYYVYNDHSDKRFESSIWVADPFSVQLHYVGQTC